MQFTRVAPLALLVANVMTSSLVRAQEQPLRVALFKTAADDPSLADFATALDPLVSSKLSEFASVTIAARPALDLPSMQLAIDCVGETADCLNAAAKQADADSLLAPSVTRDQNAVVVTLLHFDPALGVARTVHRRYEGERVGEQALSGVDGMLAELFGEDIPASQPQVAPATPATETAPPPLAAPPTRAKPAGVPFASVILGGFGVALVGTGIAFGVMSNASHNAFLDIDVTDADSAHSAIAKENAAQDQATVANVTLGLGVAAIVGAGVLLYWQLKERNSDSKPQSHVSLAPRIAPREAGLTLTAAWNGAL
ncbi:MAG TPA: hypothetical protein VFG30_19950 [Polyangiales bacterium]|nr:hypothetical protein [Polyangiales bacterium]